MDRQIIRCRDIGAYAHALTRGKEYVVENTDENKFRIVGDHGRKVWISKDYFCRKMKISYSCRNGTLIKILKVNYL